jgi:uncharacterized lipoprotein YbaY
MKRSRFSPLLFAVLGCAAAFAAGCGKDKPNAPAPPSSQITRQAADDLASQFAVTLSHQGGLPLSQLGSTTLQDVASGRAPATMLPGAGATKTSDEGSFSWSFSLRYFDADGNEQPSFELGTTAEIRVAARAHGSFTNAEHQATVGTERSLDVHGLLPDETTLTIDGAQSDTVDAAYHESDGSESRTYHLLGLGALTDVKQLKDKSMNPYPLSGTASWDVMVDATSTDAEGPHEAHYHATVQVTFNGTKNPTIEISETYRYEMNLDTGTVRPLPA